MNGKRRILLAAPFPYASTSGQGGATVCAKSLQLLQQSFEVGMVCFSTHSQADTQAEAALKQDLAWFDTVPLRIRKWQVLRAKLASFLLRPEHTFYFNSPLMRLALAKACGSFKPDIVIYQFPQMAQYIGTSAQPHQAIMDVQDAYSVSWFRRATSATTWWTRLYAYIQWLGWIRYERCHYAKADQVWTLSAQDRFGLTAYSPNLAPVVMGIPLGAQPPVTGVTARASASAQIGFIGSFGHPPNVEALRFLCQHIAPLATKAGMNVRFLVAGREPPADIVRAAPPNVQFLGFVDSVAEFYAQCDIVIAPLLSGGGIKIKVAEAMGHGKALITTAIGAEGLDIDSGHHALIADSADSFVAAISTLLGNDALRQKMGLAAHQMARQQFDGQQWLARVAKALHSAP